MYTWHCPNCGWDGQITDEVQAVAVTEADKIQATHHIEHCPRCQWVVRIPVDLLRTASPATKLAAKKPAAKQKSVKKVVAKKPGVKKAAPKKKPAAKKPAAKHKK